MDEEEEEKRRRRWNSRLGNKSPGNEKLNNYQGKASQIKVGRKASRAGVLEFALNKSTFLVVIHGGWVRDCIREPMIPSDEDNACIVL